MGIDDDARDFIEAKQDIKRATAAAMIVAAVTLIVALFGSFGIWLDDYHHNHWEMYLAVAISLGLGYGIHRFSRVCAIAMFLFYMADLLCGVAMTGHFRGAIIRTVFLYFFGRAMQGTFTYHRLKPK